MRRLVVLTVFAAVSSAYFALAQALPAPSYLVNSASYGQAVSPESLATIFGKNLSVGEFTAAVLPLPTKLGETEVFSCVYQYAFAKECPGGQPCCVQAELLYVGPNQINLRMPTSTLGESERRDIVVRVSGNAVKSQSSAYVDRAAPGIFEMGWDCGIDPRWPDTSPCGVSWTKRGEKQVKRGAITDQAGNLVTSNNPARMSQYYTLWFTGLGKITNGKTVGTVNLVLYDIPVYGDPGQSYRQWATVTWAGHSPQFPGLDQINFKLPDWLMGGKPEWNGYPPMHPCGDYNLELTLLVAISSYGSENVVRIPVSIKSGDVPCAVR